MVRQEITCPKIPSYGVYACSHATRAGNTIYLSGQASVSAQGNLLHRGDLVAQTAQAFENMKAVLETAGSSLKDVVQYSVYVLDNSAWDKISATRQRYFNTHPLPACVGVVVKDLYPPGILIEMDAIAVVGD